MLSIELDVFDNTHIWRSFISFMYPRDFQDSTCSKCISTSTILRHLIILHVPLFVPPYDSGYSRKILRFEVF